MDVLVEVVHRRAKGRYDKRRPGTLHLKHAAKDWHGTALGTGFEGQRWVNEHRILSRAVARECGISSGLSMARDPTLAWGGLVSSGHDLVSGPLEAEEDAASRAAVSVF